MSITLQPWVENAKCYRLIEGVVEESWVQMKCKASERLCRFGPEFPMTQTSC